MAREMKDSGIEWIGETPEEWEQVKLGFLYSFSSGDNLTTQDFDDNGEYPVFGANGQRGYFNNFNTSGKHILIGRVGALCGNIHLINSNVWVTEHALISQKLTNLITDEYSVYLLTAMGLRQYASGTAQPVISAEKIRKLCVPLPSLSEQQRIVSFLNNDCARIDAVIEKTRTSIEEYKKLKQAVITQAVTKSIRPNRPMKDSGIDWVGAIPSNWKVQRIKTIFKLRDERNYLPLEEVNLISLYTDLGVVQHCDLDKTTGNKASNADGYKKVYENDIIVNIILCWMGAIGRSAYSGVTSPAYDIYIPSEEIECRFYHHYFRTNGFSGDCYKRGKGIMAMRWRTYSDQFRDIKVVVPPIEEQREILSYLDQKTGEIDSLISKKERLLSEIEVYKKTLIYEYVTGKKEVPA